MPCRYCLGLLMQNPQFLTNEIKKEMERSGNRNAYAVAHSVLTKLGVPHFDRSLYIIDAIHLL